MGEVFCSHYVQVSQRVREVGEVFCSHYVQVSEGGGGSEKWEKFSVHIMSR